MAVFLAPGPFGAGYQAFDSNGVPLNSGLIYTYAAGSTTTQATFTTSTGNVTNAAPITLSADGRPQNSGNLVEIWLTSGIAYKFTITDSLNNQIAVYDNLVGINDIGAQSEWVLAATPVFVSATQFTVAGNQTLLFDVGRRVKAVVTAGTIFGTVSAVAFVTTTTVTVDWDSTQLDSGLSAVSYGLLDASKPSIPTTRMDQPTETITAAATLDLGIVRARSIAIAGSTSITRLSIPDGQVRNIVFNNQLTLSNTVSQILTVSGGTTITTNTGDAAVVRGEPGLARFISYQRSGGFPLTNTPLTNSLSGDIALNNTGNYFTGPSVTQGSLGTWLVMGTVTFQDTAGGAQFVAKLWDGTTVVASGDVVTSAINEIGAMALSGFITAPAGNLRIDVRDTGSTSGKIVFNASGNSKDSTITAVRIG